MTRVEVRFTDGEDITPDFMAYLKRGLRISGDRKLPTLYISGPMTGYPEFNYPAFREAAKTLRAYGWVVIDPSEHFGGRRDLSRHKYLAADVTALIMKCRAVALLDGWQDSEGAKLEAQIGLDRGYEFFDWSEGRLWPLPHEAVEALLA